MIKKYFMIFLIMSIIGASSIQPGLSNEIDVIIAKIKNTDPEERLQGLLHFNSLDREICQRNISLVIPLIYDNDENVKRFAIIESGYIFLKSPENGVLVMPPFNLPRLKKTELYIETAKIVMPHLIEKVKKENFLLQADALFSIACIAEADIYDVKEIIKYLESENEKVRYYTLVALGNIGRNSKEAVPAIQLIISKDESGLVRGAAKKSLNLILK